MTRQHLAVAGGFRYVERSVIPGDRTPKGSGQRQSTAAGDGLFRNSCRYRHKLALTGDRTA